MAMNEEKMNEMPTDESPEEKYSCNYSWQV